MIDPKLKLVAKKWQQETEDWLRKNHYSDIKIYKHYTEINKKDGLAAIYLESPELDRVIILKIVKYSEFTKIVILGEFRKITGSICYIDESMPIPGCNFREGDYSFYISDKTEKNIQELNRICLNFTKLLQTHLLPIIEGKAWYDNSFDYKA